MKLDRALPPQSRENGDGSAFSPPSAVQAEGEEDEEEELRNWADLRECQTRFAANGGFLTEF